MDIGAGIAAMGKSLMQSSSMIAQESIRAGYDQDKLKLAAELQATEAEKARGAEAEQRRLDRESRETEGAANRASEEKRTAMSAQASITSSSISAGGTIRAQQIAADSRLKEAELQDKFKRDELAQNKVLQEQQLKTPSVRELDERAKMSPEQRAEYDKLVESKKEPKTPYELIPNDGNPVVLNKQTGKVTSGVPEGGPTTGGKKLETSERKELKSMADPAISLVDLAMSFKPSFGGALTETTGRAANAVGRNFSLAGPELKEQAAWWQAYQRFSNIEQNALYGAALSKMEQENFKAAMVTPDMQPDMIKNNLQRQQDIALTALARYSTSLLKDGYRPESIESVTGLRFYQNEANYNSFQPGTIYIAPNGKVMRKQSAPGGY